jgi:hypothetical protein
MTNLFCKCPLCQKEKFSVSTANSSVSSIDCCICGNFNIHNSFKSDQYSSDLYILSGWARERTEKKLQPLTILPNDVNPSADGITVEAILSLPTIPQTIDENIIKLLDAIKRKSRFFGDEISISGSNDYTLAFLEHTERDEYNIRHPINKLLEQVDKLGWINLCSADKNRYEITIEGLRIIEKAKQSIPQGVDCFIAMKYGDKLLDKAYINGMIPAIKDAGYKPIQMAYQEHNNNIMDEMVACIRKCRFVVADLSFQNQNVYFEAGFAQGLGIPVIYTCHEYHVDQIKFDTQHTNQIRWAEIEDLRVKLKNRILATI